MYISRKSMFIIVALLLSMLSPMLAQGACSQNNLTGTWYAYGNSGNEIERCKIKVNSSGSIVGSKSKCSARDATGRFSLNIGGGNLQVSSACVVKGRINFCEASCTALRIEHGMLERDKNILTVEGYLVVDPRYTASLVGVKK